MPRSHPVRFASWLINLQSVTLHVAIFCDKTFRHKVLKAFFDKGSMAGIQAAHAPRLAAMLRRLNETTNAQGTNLPGWGLPRPSKGENLKGIFQFGLMATGV